MSNDCYILPDVMLLQRGHPFKTTEPQRTSDNGKEGRVRPAVPPCGEARQAAIKSPQHTLALGVRLSQPEDPLQQIRRYLGASLLEQFVSTGLNPTTCAFTLLIRSASCLLGTHLPSIPDGAGRMMRQNLGRTVKWVLSLLLGLLHAK